MGKKFWSDAWYFLSLCIPNKFFSESYLDICFKISYDKKCENCDNLGLQRSYGFLITKEMIFGFQILDLKDHFSASLKMSLLFKILYTAEDEFNDRQA